VTDYPHVQQVKLAALDKVDAFHVVHFKYKATERSARVFSENDVVLIAEQNKVHPSSSSNVSFV
jgi:hypothetical protein